MPIHVHLNRWQRMCAWCPVASRRTHCERCSLKPSAVHMSSGFSDLVSFIGSASPREVVIVPFIVAALVDVLALASACHVPCLLALQSVAAGRFCMTTPNATL